MALEFPLKATEVLQKCYASQGLPEQAIDPVLPEALLVSAMKVRPQFQPKECSTGIVPLILPANR